MRSARWSIRGGGGLLLLGLWSCAVALREPFAAAYINREDDSIELSELGAGELLFPEGMAIDRAGVLFVADKGHHRVVKIASETDQTASVAGNGQPGSQGSGGYALQAGLCLPEAVAVDADGTLYVADTFNSRICKVDLNGRLTTIAGTDDVGDGGLPEDATVSLVGSLETDGDTLYVTDTGHHRIRAVDLRRRTVKTVAGSGEPGFGGDGGSALKARLFRPEFIALDTDKNLYISDTFNNRIRKVDRRTGIITTIAGTSEPGYNGDGMVATRAQLFSPEGLAIDRAGNIFVADMGNDRIRRLDARTGVITTVVGNGQTGFNGDGKTGENTSLNFPLSLAYDQKREALFISDKFNQRIRKLELRTNLVTTVAGTGGAGNSGDHVAATEAELFNPEGILLDASGNLYIADHTNYRVRRVDAATGKISTVAGVGVPGYTGNGGPALAASLFSPNRLALNRSALYLAEGNVIREIDLKSGIIRAIIGSRVSNSEAPARRTSLSLPSGLAIFGHELYVSDTGNHRVLKISLGSGRSQVVLGNGHPGSSGDGGLARNAQLSLPQSLAFDTAGNLYIADAGNNKVRRVERSNALVKTIIESGLEGFDKGGVPEVAARSLIMDVKVAADGTLLIADLGNGRVRRADLNRGIINTIAGAPERTLAGRYVPLLPMPLNQPKRIAVDEQGALFIADTTSRRILKLSLKKARAP
jgi:sugar lactone lactonase YvrE